MLRLLWKEYRERRLWSLLLLGAILGVVAWGQSYTFSGDAPSQWTFLSAVAALLFGAGAYNSEIGGGTADFLYSRRVSWKKILLSKILVGLLLLLVTLVSAAILYRLTCSHTYAPFATLPRLAAGVAQGMALLGMLFLAGLVSSTALPGTFGGLIIFLALCTALGVYTQVLADLHPDYPLVGNAMGVVAAWGLAAAVATILVARYGLTLNLSSRAKRYALVALTLGILLEPISLLIPFGSDSPRVSASYFPSPDGRYAAVQWKRPGDARYEAVGDVYILRVSDMSQARLTLDTGGGLPHMKDSYWADSRHLVVEDWNTLVTVHDGKRKLTEKNLTVRRFSVPKGFVFASPDRKHLALISGFNGPSNGRQLTVNSGARGFLYQYEPINRTEVEVLDALSGKTVAGPLNGITDFWWQSNTQIGYTDAKSKRHILRVAPKSL